MKRKFQKEKLQNRGSAIIICIFSILILSLSLSILYVDFSTKSKKYYSLSSVSMVTFDNWYYSVLLDKSNFSDILIYNDFDFIRLINYWEYVSFYSSSNSLYVYVDFTRDEDRNIIFDEKWIINV